MAFGFGFALTAIAKAVGFSPSSLFTSGAQGAWYDPSDYTTLFEDAAGTTPITSPLEKPVGLMLDKSKGLVLGSELVTNGTFDADVSGWTTSSSRSGSSVWIENSGNGAAKITNISGIATQFSQALAVTAGKTYQITANITYISGSISGNVSVRTSANAATSSYLGGQTLNAATNTGVSFYYLALSTTTVYVGSLAYTSACSYSLDNISVRELTGNHAYQSTTTSRPTLSARYNLLTKTEQFDDAAWVKTNTTVTANAITAPDGTLTADKLQEDATSNPHYVGAALSGLSDNVSYTFSCHLKAAERSWGRLSMTTKAGTVFRVWFNLETGAKGTDQTSGATGAIQPVGNGWYRCSMTVPMSSGATSPDVTVLPTNADNTTTIQGVLGNGIYLWGADLRVANDGVGLPAYQRVNTATDYDYAGFPPYLKFDGTDDGMATGNIDFTGTDKMSVFAGGRKLATDNTSAGMFAELSASSTANAGTFACYAPGGSTDTYQWFVQSRGAGALGEAYVNNAIYKSPSTKAVTGVFDISGDAANLRLNGTQVATSAADQGTGNFGTYPLYIGRRGGTTMPFNGRLYSLVVCGKLASAAEIASTEAYINQKTRAY